jgi:WD40 repeat protein
VRKTNTNTNTSTKTKQVDKVLPVATVTAQRSDAMIATAKLQGHGASVLCLDVFSPSSQSSSSSSPHSSPFSSSTSALLLSGSEDGTARLWDLRDHKRRACLCIRVPGGGNVLSAVFSPPAPAVEATTITTIRRENDAFSRDCSVYLGVENTVLEYDLRHADSPIICSEPTRDWGRVLQNQDEVNQIGLVYYNKNNGNNNNNNNSTTKKKKNQKKKGGGNNNKKRLQSSVEDVPDGSLYLAACDDAGKARWTEVWSSSRESDEASCNHFQHASSTILHHDNHGVAIVPACAFRPSNMNSSHKRRGGGGGGGGTSLEFVTGGTDCKIQLWDIFRSKYVDEDVIES